MEGLPGNFGVSVDPPSGKPPFKSIIKIKIPDEAHGTYKFNVVAYSPEDEWREEVKNLSLNVPWGDIQMLCDAAEKKVAKGGETIFTLQVIPVEGFKGKVSLSVVGAPAGVVVTSSPSSGVPPFTATILVKATETAPAGRYCFEIRAAGGGVEHSMDLCVEVYETEETTEVEKAGLKIKEIYIYLAVLLVIALIALIIILKKT